MIAFDVVITMFNGIHVDVGQLVVIVEFSSERFDFVSGQCFCGSRDKGFRVGIERALMMIVVFFVEGGLTHHEFDAGDIVIRRIDHDIEDVSEFTPFFGLVDGLEDRGHRISEFGMLFVSRRVLEHRFDSAFASC